MQSSLSEIRLVLIASTILILLLALILVISINITRNRKARLQQQLAEESLKLQQAEINYERELFEKQKAQFEKQKAIELERNRISAELHDDMGGELSAIRLLSEMNTPNINPQQQLSKISSSSAELMQKLNEIVWALNVSNDSVQSLIAYLRRYAVKYLDDVNIDCSFQQPESIPDKEVDGITRRNIFLLLKEALNNVVKHAQATEVKITITLNEVLQIAIYDNGTGIPAETLQNSSGNGLRNMMQRVSNLSGNMEVINDKGTTIQFNLPVSYHNTKG